MITAVPITNIQEPTLKCLWRIAADKLTASLVDPIHFKNFTIDNKHVYPNATLLGLNINVRFCFEAF